MAARAESAHRLWAGPRWQDVAERRYHSGGGASAAWGLRQPSGSRSFGPVDHTPSSPRRHEVPGSEPVPERWRGGLGQHTPPAGRPAGGSRWAAERSRGFVPAAVPEWGWPEYPRPRPVGPELFSLRVPRGGEKPGARGLNKWETGYSGAHLTPSGAPRRAGTVRPGQAGGSGGTSASAARGAWAGSFWAPPALGSWRLSVVWSLRPFGRTNWGTICNQWTGAGRSTRWKSELGKKSTNQWAKGWTEPLALPPYHCQVSTASCLPACDLVAPWDTKKDWG